MRFVSPFLKRVVYPCLAGGGYFRSRKRSGLAVITYHGVVPRGYQRIDSGLDGGLVETEMFRRQLRLLKSNYNVISPDEMLSWCRRECELPPRAVLLTCDDGLRNNLTEMLPVLRQEELRCLFFITGASAGDTSRMLWYEELLLLLLQVPSGAFRVSTDNFEFAAELGSREPRRRLWWNLVKDLSRLDFHSRQLFLDRAYAHVEPETSVEFREKVYPHALNWLGLMTRTEVRQMAAAGMTIGAHTCSHSVMAQQPPELARQEIKESRERLESVLNRKIWAFAYPFGQTDTVSPEVVSMAQEAGFAVAFMNVGGGLGAELPLYAIPRVHVNADMDLAEFEAHVSGFYGELVRRFGRRAANPLKLDFNSKCTVPRGKPVSKQKTA
jgi:peptidoglycan/xylan/chitin deacetylase (PgdA/CDA1 family)